MAACDDFSITVLGRGGHGAAPRGTIDAIVEAAHLVTALQVRRLRPPPRRTVTARLDLWRRPS